MKKWAFLFMGLMILFLILGCNSLSSTTEVTESEDQTTITTTDTTSDLTTNEPKALILACKKDLLVELCIE